MPITRTLDLHLGAFLSFFLLLAPLARSLADDLDTVGVRQLRLASPTLVGTGVLVAQPEADFPGWEVNPAEVGQPGSLFTYFSSSGSDTSFPNSVGAVSDHARGVGTFFYSPAQGAAPGVEHVDNYEANYFYENFILRQNAINAKVVNQSFIFLNDPDPVQQRMIDTNYDNYIARYDVLIVSGAGNVGSVGPPATAYNGIGVAVYPGNSSTGPTVENGRSKPDITAPFDFTSWSTPLVAGAATLLVQAGNRGDGGDGTAGAATDTRTLKALLLNGAVKPNDWTHTVSAPLDTRYGAGVLQVYNSYRQLAGGQHASIEFSSSPTGGPHLPTSANGNISALAGWDFRGIDNSENRDAVNHYFFELTGSPAAAYLSTITLVWNRQMNRDAINDLDLFLYDAKSNSLVASSVSTVDNVEHVFVSGLKPGRYDLQVLKNGGMAHVVSNDETYALAWDFLPLTLEFARTGNSILLSWPGSAAQFSLQMSADLAAVQGWTTVDSPVVVASGRNTVTVTASGGNQFFRLISP